MKDEIFTHSNLVLQGNKLWYLSSRGMLCNIDINTYEYSCEGIVPVKLGVGYFGRFIKFVEEDVLYIFMNESKQFYYSIANKEFIIADRDEVFEKENMDELEKNKMMSALLRQCIEKDNEYRWTLLEEQKYVTIDASSYQLIIVNLIDKEVKKNDIIVKDGWDDEIREIDEILLEAQSFQECRYGFTLQRFLRMVL